MTIEEELLPEEKSLTNYHDDNAETCSETSESSTSSMDDIQDNSRRSMRETAKRESVDDDEMENVGTKKLVQQDFVYNKKENIYSDDNDHDDSDNSDSDENNDGVEDDDDDTSILISNTNKLLSAVGIAAKKIVSKDELARVAPSMFVAVYESLYHTRIEGIIRNPDSRLDYELNAQLVIDHLSDQINIDLAHISGVAIVAGNLKQLTDLIHIFMRIISLTSEASISTIGSSVLESSTDSYSARGFANEFLNFRTLVEFDGLKNKLALRNRQQQVESNNNLLKTSTKIPNLIRETLQRTEKKIVGEIKQNNAAKRRNRILSNKEAISRKANQLKTKRSAKILLSKYEQAKHMEQKAFETKLINQEKVMLAKLYRSLFRETIASKVDNHRQMKLKEDEMIKNVNNQIAALEQTFKEKLSIVESYYSKVKDLDRANENANVQSIMESIVFELQRQENLLSQNRDKAILHRKQMLLACNQRELKKGDWEEYLRSYPSI